MNTLVYCLLLDTRARPALQACRHTVAGMLWPGITAAGRSPTGRRAARTCGSVSKLPWKSTSVAGPPDGLPMVTSYRRTVAT